MEGTFSNVSENNGTRSSPSLDDLNTLMREIRIPSLCILTIQIVLGVLGNMLVIQIYWRNLSSKLELFYFIPWLAFFDINAIISGGVLSILEDLFSMNFPSLYLCQGLWFIMIFCTATGASCLLIIAVQRYTYVFKKPVLKLKWRRLYIVFNLIFAAVIAFPVFLLVDLRDISIEGVNGKVCGDTSKDDLLLYKYSYLHFLLILICVNIIVITILYIRIGLKTFQLLTVSGSSNYASPAGRRAGLKFTLMYITVFIVYFVAYIPTNAILLLPDETKSKIFHNYKNKFEMNGILVLHRMYLFSHVLNPLIFFIFHAKFRKEVRGLLNTCKVFCASILHANELRDNIY